MGLRKYSESAISDPHNQTPDCDDESLTGAKNIVGIGIWLLLRRYQICRAWRQMAYTSWGKQIDRRLEWSIRILNNI